MIETLFKWESEIKKFLRSGELGSFNLVFSERDLQNLLGKPNDYFVRDRGSPKPTPDASPDKIIVYYGNFGVTFEDDRVIGVCVDYRSKRFKIPKKLKVTWPGEIRDLAPETFVRFLNETSTPYEYLSGLDRQNGKVEFELHKGSSVAFSSEHGDLELLAFWILW